MSNPPVCAIMLVNGRAPMVARAVRSFREQTYQDKRLLLWDSSPEKFLPMSYVMPENEKCTEDVDDFTVGELRNRANHWPWARGAEILIHFDSDDWSHPRRIEEQVALLQASGKECVGYRDMLFWKECSWCVGGRGNILPHCPKCGIKYDPSRELPVGEAWLYINTDKSACVGTSFCYWHKTWERRPFADEPKHRGGTGEDVLWLREVDSLGVSSSEIEREPRMIASIHGSNTQNYDLVVGQSPSWRRAPEWDAYARERMA